MSQIVIHYLTPHAAGPVVSEPNPKLMEVFGAGAGGRFAVACDPSLVMGDVHRGSGETFACTCPDCRDTEVFRANEKPHPKLAERARRPLPPPTECKT